VKIRTQVGKFEVVLMILKRVFSVFDHLKKKENGKEYEKL